MEIKIKSLRLRNFKGIRDYSIEFNPGTTSIYGDNGTGKTTLFDAFMWLLFGKDSHDTKDFNIKTIGTDGQPIPRLEHEVEGVLEVGGSITKLRRLYQEKWVRRRGSEIEEMSGHETAYFQNDVPMSAAQYKQIVDRVLDEGLFKLITSPLHFNSLPWKDRRAMLLKMAGDITTDSVIEKWTINDQKDVLAIVNGPKSIDELRREKAAEKKRLNDELRQIPSRIDEVNRAMPDELDYTSIESSIETKQKSLIEIESAITDQVEAYRQQGEEIQRKQSEINNLKRRMNEVKFAAEQNAQDEVNKAKIEKKEIENNLQSARYNLKSAESTLSELDVRAKSLTGQIEQSRGEWHRINDETLTIDETKFTCHTCSTPLDPATISAKRETMQRDFEANKARRLNECKDKGTRAKTELEGIEARVSELRDKIESLTKQADTIQQQYDSFVIPAAGEPVLPPLYSELQSQVETAELQVLETPRLDVDALKQQKAVLQSDIDVLRRQLQSKSQRESATRRIDELKAQESILAGQLAGIEKIESICDRYVTAMMAEVETRVNGLFELVRWRLFTQQINGGTEETCDCMIDGVPYSDLNNAGKIRAGVDCINSLSRFFNVYAPIWIDNRESVNVLPLIQSQIINLYVSYDKVLTIK